MAGIDPDTGEPIYYPGENRSKSDKFLHGSSIHGGGFLSFVGPLLMILGVTLFVWAMTLPDQVEPTAAPTIEQAP